MQRQIHELPPASLVALCEQQAQRHRNAFTHEEKAKVVCSQRAFAAVTGNEPPTEQRAVCTKAFAACLAATPPDVEAAAIVRCDNFEAVKRMFTCGDATVEQTVACWIEQDERARSVVVNDPCAELTGDGKDKAYARYVARYEGDACAALDKTCHITH